MPSSGELTARHKAWALLELVRVWDMQDRRKRIVLRWLRDIWSLYCKAQLLSKMVHCRITLGALGQIVIRWRKLTYFKMRIKCAIRHFYLRRSWSDRVRLAYKL